MSLGWAGVLAALACGLGFYQSASAQPASAAWPRCVPELEGQQTGFGGSVCECEFQRGGSLTGRKPGWRWSCDIMRMDGSEFGGGDLLGGGTALPPGFVYAPQGGIGSAEPRPFDRYGRP